MKYLNRLKELTFLDGYRLRVTFRDDYTSEIDLSPLFANPKGPLTEAFRDPSFFQRAFLDEGTLACANGYDICSDVLRYYCEQGRVTSKEEMNAYFTEDVRTSALREEPHHK